MSNATASVSVSVEAWATTGSASSNARPIIKTWPLAPFSAVLRHSCSATSGPLVSLKVATQSAIMVSLLTNLIFSLSVIPISAAACSFVSVDGALKFSLASSMKACNAPSRMSGKVSISM
ncbi:hypothetical protein G6F68_019889 [Rhizopus microsporus]|nr:hypothetical protein G6F68_019889 [Rhizopus microsporus]